MFVHGEDSRSVVPHRAMMYSVLCSASLARPSCHSLTAAWAPALLGKIPALILLLLRAHCWMHLVFKDLNQRWLLELLSHLWCWPCWLGGWLPGFLLVTCTFASSVVFINPSLTLHKQKLYNGTCFCFAASLISATTWGGAGAQDSRTWCSGTGFPPTSWGE